MRGKKALIAEIEHTVAKMQELQLKLVMGRIERSDYEWDMNFLRGQLSSLQFMLGYRKNISEELLALLDNANITKSNEG